MTGLLDAINPFTSSIKAVGDVVTGVTRTIWGDQAERDQALHDENAASLEEYAAEFTPTAQRTLLDSLADFLNRLIRPVLALLVIGVFVWCPIDPVTFTVAMKAYGLMPEWLSYIMLAIIAFYFGSRHLEKRLELNKPGPTVEQVRSFIDLNREIRALRTTGPTMTDAEYATEMADTSKPLTNAAILEWNRRRKGV